MLDNKIKQIFNQDFPSIKERRKGIVDSIVSAISDQNLPLSVKKEEMYLAIDEAITNAMEHGNKWSSEKPVSIEISSNKTDLNITISDQGSGFDPAINGENPLESDRFRKRGRGLYIISQFCKISWNAKGNSITLSFPIEN